MGALSLALNKLNERERERDRERDRDRDRDRQTDRDRDRERQRDRMGKKTKTGQECTFHDKPPSRGGPLREGVAVRPVLSDMMSVIQHATLPGTKRKLASCAHTRG